MMLLAAIGCGRVPFILKINKKYSLVVFGTMDAKPLSLFSNHAGGIMDSQVYFYETG
jgi:hypothetical protein